MKKMKLLALALCTGLVLTACGQAETEPAEEVEVVEEAEQVEEEQGNEAVEEDIEDAETEEESEEETETDETVSENEEAAGLSDLYGQIESAVELVDPSQPSSDFIFNYYGIKLDEYEDFLFEISAEATSAEAVIVLKTNGSDQADSAKLLLEGYLDEKKLELEDYLPEEYTIVADSKVVEKNDYIYLVISHNASDIIDIIENNL